MTKGKWYAPGPCSEREIRELVRCAPVELPAEYLGFLSETNGAGGDLPVQPWWIVFWTAADVNENNIGYEVVLNVPGFYAFAASGGGEMFAFDARRTKPWPVVMIPFIGMQ